MTRPEMQETSPFNYERLLESSTHPIFSLDREYRFTCFNSALSNMMKTFYGVTIQIGDMLSELQRNPDNWQLIKTHLDQALGGMPVHVSGWSTGLEKTRKYFEMHIFPIHSKTGEVVGLSVFANDNTERQRVEEGIQESEARHRTILQTAMDGFWLIDLQGRLLEVNDTYCRMSGYKESELLRMCVTDLKANANRDETAERIQKIVQGGEDRFEARHKRKDGSIFDVEISVKYRPVKDGQIVCFLRDITEVKNVHQARIESEYFFKESQKAAFIGSYKTDFTKGRWESSEILDQIFGIAQGHDRSVQGWLEIVHPDDREMMNKYLHAEVIAKGHPFEKEYRIIRNSDGAIRWVRGLGRVDSDLAGNIVSMIGTIQDITDRVQNQEERLSSERQFRLIFENASDGILLVDTKTKQFAMGNNKIIQMLGYDLSELKKLTASDIHPKEDLSSVFGAFEKQRREENSLTIFPVKRKDGSTFIAEINSFPLIIEGKEMLIGLFRDVTERQQIEEALRAAEEKYRALVETTDTGYHILDQNGKVLDANQEYVRQTGHHSLSEIVGRSIVEWTAEYDLPKNAAAVAKCIKDGGVRNFLIDYVDKHGRITPIEINATVQKTASSFHIIALCRDISERKRGEKEKLDLQAKLLHASKLASIGTLAAGVAHEINNPLMISVGCTEEMLRTCADPSRASDRNFLQTIQNASMRIASIVKSLKTYARQGNEEIQDVDMHLCINETLQIVQSIYHKENIKIEKHLNAHDSFIKGNMGKMQQVIMNVVENAKDALNGHLNAVIRITTQNKNDGLVIEISDNGVGIPKHLIPKLFDPFFTTKEVGKGTGLGLSISDAIIASLGGTLSVESVLDAGATFRIFLPRPHKSKLICEKVSRGDDDFRIEGHVLVVDDEKVIRDILGMYLSSFGLNVAYAENGEAAYQMILKEKFDYVFLDLQMPKMNGDKLIYKIKSEKLAANTKFVVITGDINEQSVEKVSSSSAAKGDAYLYKPFSRHNIIPVLKAVMI